ncbi:ROK family protein [Streptomyces sp. 6N223]|uniref:ROK family protein n=1 Tax=Streptomyces sp. 6N223 TaxID=3457412 RepID=UPI003FD552FA
MAQQPQGALAQLRRGHQERVLDLLRRHGALSRGELGHRSGLSRTTLHDIVSGLMANGTVVATVPDQAVRGRGRPAESLSLNPAAGQAIGIDFAHRRLHVAIVNVAHEIIGSASEGHAANPPWQRRVEIAERLIGELSEGRSADGADGADGAGDGAAGGRVRLGALRAIGVGVVGPVGSPGEENAAARRLDAVPTLLRKRFGVPVLMDNNTRLAALAESIWGAAAGCQDVLYLRLSHGVGGGLVLGGSLHRGAHGVSGEFGHITVDPDGRACRCGGRGCLETIASVKAVLDAHREAGGRARTLRALASAAGAGDPGVGDLLARVGGQVGLVLASVCNTVGPDLVVLGGEVAEVGAALTDPVERELRAHVMPMLRRRLKVRAARLGETGGALGGIALVLHESPLLARYPPSPAPHDPDSPASDPTSYYAGDLYARASRRRTVP